MKDVDKRGDALRRRNLEIVAAVLAEESTLQEIGDRYGITRERVRQIAKKYKVERRRRYRSESMIRKGQLAELLRTGPERTLEELAELVEAPRSTVAHWTEGGDEEITKLYRKAQRRWRAERRNVRNNVPRVCPRCGELREAEEFHWAKKDVIRQSWCAECKRAISYAHWEERRGKYPEPTVTEKRCSKCQTVRPAEEFYRCTGHWTGLQGWCKWCRSR